MTKMKIGVILLLFCFWGAGPTFSQDGRSQTGQSLIKTQILENFEKPDSWVVKFSRFRKYSWKDHAAAEFESSAKWIHWKTLDMENYIYYAKPEPPGEEGTKGKTIMGVRGKFYTKGYNWLAVEPKQDLYLRGKALSLRVWVWGGNFDYDLYAVLQNYRGRYYTMKMGNLKFKGWKQLTADLEVWKIDQTRQWVPQQAPLKFVRFLVVSGINERPDRFGIWFDDMAYDTDLFDPVYYGKALGKEFDWDE